MCTVLRADTDLRYRLAAAVWGLGVAEAGVGINHLHWQSQQNKAIRHM